MVHRRHPLIGLALLGAALSSAGLCYYLSWRAGCLFDGKVGNGSYASSSPFSHGAWLAALLSLLLSITAVPIGLRRSAAVWAGSALFVTVLAVPLLIGLVWAGETAGVSRCAP